MFYRILSGPSVLARETQNARTSVFVTCLSLLFLSCSSQFCSIGTFKIGKNAGKAHMNTSPVSTNLFLKSSYFCQEETSLNCRLVKVFQMQILDMFLSEGVFFRFRCVCDNGRPGADNAEVCDKRRQRDLVVSSQRSAGATIQGRVEERGEEDLPVHQGARSAISILSHGWS